jgi:hypothetical protein
MENVGSYTKEDQKKIFLANFTKTRPSVINSMAPQKWPCADPWNLKTCFTTWQKELCKCNYNYGPYTKAIILNYPGGSF